MKFPFIEIEGTPYELGFQHGAAFKPQVQRSIACYREMFLDYSDLTWERAKELSRRFIPMIEAYNADYLEEIRGVADAMLAICKRIAPELFYGAGPGCVRGNCPEALPCGKRRQETDWDVLPEQALKGYADSGH